MGADMGAGMEAGRQGRDPPAADPAAGKVSPALIDIGANLAHDSFDADRDAVLARAHAARVTDIVITGSCATSNARAARLVHEYRHHAHRPALYATAGLHPHHASEWSPALAAQIGELGAQPQTVALGECGLDYCRNYSPHDAQRHAFRAQLELAAGLGKPVFLHQRDAHADFLAILREHRPQLGAVVVHCFTDTQAALEDYLALDCHIGITGWICDERRGKALLDAVRIIPDARLMIETDAPYLLPRTAPKTASRRNEPACLPWVLRTLAQARGQDEASLAAQTTANASAFFGLAGGT